MNAQGLQLLPDDALRHALAQILHQKSRTAVLREREGVETHTLPPSRDRKRADSGPKLLAVDGTSFKFGRQTARARRP